MDDKNFLAAGRFVGQTIEFVDPVPGSWTIVQKFSEKHAQDLPDSVSFAGGTFLCQNDAHPPVQAQMKIWMQVPSIGMEFETPERRAAAATPRLPFAPEAELVVFQRLAEGTHSFAPKPLGIKRGVQDNNGLMPGGFIIHLVYAPLPGVRLGPNVADLSLFYRLPFEERERIRAAFKEELTKAEMAGIRFAPGCLDNIVWHNKSGTLSFIDFEECVLKDSPKFSFSNMCFDDWGLAIGPLGEYWKEPEYNPDDMVASGWRI